IGIRMGRLLDDARDDDRLQVGTQRDQLVDRGRVCRERVAQLGGCHPERDEGPQPVVRNVHSAICSRNLTSESYRILISGIPYRLMAMRAGPMPNAQPV